MVSAVSGEPGVLFISPHYQKAICLAENENYKPERRDDSPKEQIDFTSRHNEADAGKNKLDASVCR